MMRRKRWGISLVLLGLWLLATGHVACAADEEPAEVDVVNE